MLINMKKYYLNVSKIVSFIAALSLLFTVGANSSFANPTLYDSNGFRDGYIEIEYNKDLFKSPYSYATTETIQPEETLYSYMFTKIANWLNFKAIHEYYSNNILPFIYNIEYIIDDLLAPDIW